MDIPFIPLTGVDGHNKSVPLGYAFVAHQDEKSFAWVISHLSSLVPQASSINSIITDQDAAMAAAIKTSIPYSLHQLCL
jgi:hypothetical protein